MDFGWTDGDGYRDEFPQAKRKLTKADSSGDVQRRERLYFEVHKPTLAEVTNKSDTSTLNVAQEIGALAWELYSDGT
jgi:hypothetical protein